MHVVNEGCGAGGGGEGKLIHCGCALCYPAVQVPECTAFSLWGGIRKVERGKRIMYRHESSTMHKHNLSNLLSAEHVKKQIYVFSQGSSGSCPVGPDTIPSLQMRATREQLSRWATPPASPLQTNWVVTGGQIPVPPQSHHTRGLLSHQRLRVSHRSIAPVLHSSLSTASTSSTLPETTVTQ